MTDQPRTYPLLDREKSWLHFSHRVLQEAQDPTVPLLERLFFCGIFSSNLDEYFRVRVASLRSLLRLAEGDDADHDLEPNRLLHDIHRIVLEQQEQYGPIIRGIFEDLESEGIRRVDEGSVRVEHHDFLRSYYDEVLTSLVSPVLLDDGGEKPFLKNRSIYLVVELWDATRPVSSWAPTYGLVEVPADTDRFVVLPPIDEWSEVIYVDDVIRFNLERVFPGCEVGRSYAVKLTRDAELYVEDEFDGDLVDAIRSSLKNRATGVPSRFLYDMRAPYVVVHRLQHLLGLSEEDMVLGARYHNLNDLMTFPRFGRADLCYPEWPSLPHPVLDGADSIVTAIRERDHVVHTPYQSFDYVVRFLEEAAADPDVEEVWLTVYRVAGDSAILSALIAAAEAGKRVTVFMEVQARFDEESNLTWADRLEAAGVRTLYSMRGLKVHAKIAMVVRREGGTLQRYGFIGTGNFNEKTARIYADHGIFTCDERIMEDLNRVFRFLSGEIEDPEFEHLLVAPFTLRQRFDRLIEHERVRAEEGRASGMTLKMNALQDSKIIRRLYDASAAGVPIELIVRGICCLVPGVEGSSETVMARSILDRYLEHARIYIFHHDGEELMYIASADWMRRNLSRRVEVAIPVYDPEIRRQLRALVELQLADDRKARIIDGEGHNRYVGGGPGAGSVRSQEAFRDFVAAL
jgi:polyphosphate kinase